MPCVDRGWWDGRSSLPRARRSADTLVGRGLSVTFGRLGGRHRSAVVPAAGYPFSRAARRQLRGGPGRALAPSWRPWRGALGALGLLRELKPRLVVGVGGYASVPSSWRPGSGASPPAARAKRRARGRQPAPRKIARCICVGSTTRGILSRGTSVHTGNPVRAGVLSPTGRRFRRSARLLIFGAAPAARRINRRPSRRCAYSARRRGDWPSTHQTGVAGRRRGRAPATPPSAWAGRVEPSSPTWAGPTRQPMWWWPAGAMTCAEAHRRRSAGGPSSPTRTPPTTTAAECGGPWCARGGGDDSRPRAQRRTPRAALQTLTDDPHDVRPWPHGREPSPARRGRPGGRGVCSAFSQASKRHARKPSTRETWQSRHDRTRGWIGARKRPDPDKWPAPLEQPPMLL